MQTVWGKTLGANLPKHYEARCQGCGHTGLSIDFKEGSFLSNVIRDQGYFKINCLDACPECGNKTEWIVYEV